MNKIVKKTKNHLMELMENQAIKLVVSSSDKNFIREIEIVKKMASLLGITMKGKEQFDYFKKLVEAKHPVKRWIKRINDELNPHCRNLLFMNIFLKALYWKKKKNKFAKREGFEGPTNIVVSPTMKCNLRCEGCWAGKFQKVPDLEISLLERIVEEVREMGVNFITITGGEPFIRKDLFDIYEKYPDVYFQIYTNATLISEEVAKKLGKIGNAAMMISVEGGEEKTDSRRGKGVYRKGITAMNNLKKEGVPFGFSVTATRYNVEEITSDEFIDDLIEKGCLNGWYFQYIPIGRNPDTSLMITPEQRNYLRKRVYKLRNTKPIFLVDFWNDGPLMNGCMAGGKSYLHINPLGDIEPCAFAQFAVDNIRNKTITEALKSPFFKVIREGIPYDGNLLRPCMVVDRPEILRDHVKRFGAHPTYPGGDCLFSSPVKDEVDEYAQGVKKIYDKAWQEDDWITLFTADYLE